MTKLDFILTLNEKLSDLPKKEVKERLSFYSEMIEDRIEDGVSEEEAVAEVGDIDKIVKAIKEEYSHSKKSAPQKAPKRRLKGIEVVLLILGSPIWLSLIIGAFCTVFSLWVTVWCVVISLWAVFASLVGGSIGGIVAGMIFIVTGKGFAGAFMIASALICAGLSIFAFWGSKLATKGTALLTKACAKAIKRIFTKKEKIQ